MTLIPESAKCNPRLCAPSDYPFACKPLCRMLHLQKALRSLHSLDYPEIKEVTVFQAQQAFKRAELEMKFEEDLEALQKESLF